MGLKNISLQREDINAVEIVRFDDVIVLRLPTVLSPHLQTPAAERLHFADESDLACCERLSHRCA